MPRGTPLIDQSHPPNHPTRIRGKHPKTHTRSTPADSLTQPNNQNQTGSGPPSHTTLYIVGPRGRDRRSQSASGRHADGSALPRFQVGP
jgi:hypothetical protein